MLDADIRSFFDTIDHAWMKKFVEHRIGDRRLVRLLMKWLKAGVMAHFEHVELEGVLRHAAVLVHHGGIGTSARAAGRYPASDQPRPF